MSLNLNALFAVGSLVDLHTSIWGARIKIKPIDLGIEPSDEVNKVFSLGQHRLAPSQAFEQIRTPVNQAKNAIESYSMNFAMIRGARYVPEVHIEKLMGRLVVYQQAFNVAVEEFMQNYQTMRDEQMPIIYKALQDATQSEELAKAAFSRIEAEYPSPQVVRSKFGLTWNVYAVQGSKSKAATEMIAGETAQVKSIIGEMIGELRTELSEKVSSLLEIASRGGKLTDTSIGSAMSLLTKLESMNVLGDTVLASQISSLRSALSSVDKADIHDDFKVGLNQVKTELNQSIEDAVKEAEQNLTGLGRRKLGG